MASHFLNHKTRVKTIVSNRSKLNDSKNSQRSAWHDYFKKWISISKYLTLNYTRQSMLRNSSWWLKKSKLILCNTINGWPLFCSIANYTGNGYIQIKYDRFHRPERVTLQKTDNKTGCEGNLHVRQRFKKCLSLSVNYCQISDKISSWLTRTSVFQIQNYLCSKRTAAKW